MITKEQYKKAKLWIEANRKTVAKLAGEWIAYNETGIIAHDRKQPLVLQNARASGQDFILRFLHPASFIPTPRLLPVRFRSLKAHLWEPLYLVTLSTTTNSLALDLLVDSGADFSAISYSTGTDLGFEITQNERVNHAEGVNGSVRYVDRVIDMQIDDHVFNAPVGWILDETCDDLILGREIVFDLFDIEFKQKDETIIFKKREDSPV